MKITKVEQGYDSWSFQVFATNEEVGSLINIAILSLMAIGLVDEAAETVEIDLANVPMERFYKV